MFRTLFNKVKQNFQIYSGKTMLIDKEGELWTLNAKDEAVKILKEENKSNDLINNPNKNNLLAKNK